MDAVAAVLSVVEPKLLRARFDPAAMSSAEIYPDIWADGDTFDDYLVPNLVALKGFYGAAAAQRQWVLQLLS